MDMYFISRYSSIPHSPPSRPTPDIFIPSDREIPRTVNEGIPIVVARPQSEPAEAFGRLTDLLMGEQVPVPVSAAVPAMATSGDGSSAPSRRRLFGRKG